MFIEQDASLYVHMIYGGVLGGLLVFGGVLYRRARRAEKLLLDLTRARHD